MSIDAMLATMLVVTAAAAASAEPPRVFDPSDGPKDARLTTVHDVDHPVMFHPHFTDKAGWERRARQLRRQVLVAEGLWPLPERTPLNPVIHGKIDRDDYTIEKVFFASYPGHYVSGNLYRPKNKPGKLPAVLCPHGHWPGGRFYEASEADARKQIAEGAEKTMEGARYPIQARCAMLARMGCVVFQYDMVGYADSTAIEHRAGFTDKEAILRLQSFMGLQTWNSIRALDFIAGLSDVDPKRIAVTGASGGGTQTILLVAADDRPAVAFPAVMVSEEMQGGCICENAPLLRVGTNNVELVATFAPKPLAMTGANDWTRAIETKGLPELKAVYKLFGAEQDVNAKHFSFEHNYNQVSREMMYNWMNDHLKLGWPSPVTEKPFVPVPPKELSVYDADHPRPTDTKDATSLRQYMTETSDRQIEQLWKTNRAEYRHVVDGALRVMVQDHLPSADQVIVGHASGPTVVDDVTMETGALGRRGAGEAVPYVSLTPRNWNGTVVVWANPAGKSNLFDENGKPNAAIRKLLEDKAAVICGDLLLTGEFVRPNQPAKLPGEPGYEKQDYAGFIYGYNRGLLANRIHDLLTEIAFVHQWKGTKAVELAGWSDSGPAVLLARALAGNAVRNAVIDLNNFDFDRLAKADDPMMLPGALKYGGINGFIPLCQSGKTLLIHARGDTSRGKTDGVEIRQGELSADAAVEWLLSN